MPFPPTGAFDLEELCAPQKKCSTPASGCCDRVSTSSAQAEDSGEHLSTSCSSKDPSISRLSASPEPSQCLKRSCRNNSTTEEFELPSRACPCFIISCASNRGPSQSTANALNSHSFIAIFVDPLAVKVRPSSSSSVWLCLLSLSASFCWCSATFLPIRDQNVQARSK